MITIPFTSERAELSLLSQQILQYARSRPIIDLISYTFIKQCYIHLNGHVPDWVFEPLEPQQQFLDAWCDLFRTGYLIEGWDLERPSSPYFHVRDSQQMPPPGTWEEAYMQPGWPYREEL